MIIWVASYPKSGNTLLRSILCSLIVSDDGVLDLKKLNLIPNFAQKRFFKGLTDERIHIKEISKHWIEAQKKIIGNKKFRFLKTHNANCSIDNNSFTNAEVSAGVIYVIRDPRDVVCSASKHFDLSLEKTKDILFNQYAQTIARKNIDHEITSFLGTWSDNYNSWKSFNENILVIKYEDLVLKKENSILRIVEFLNLFFPIKISKQRLENCLRTTSFKYLSSIEENEGFEESVESKGKKKIQFFNKGLVGDWKNILSTEIANEIEIKFKVEMTELEYL